MSFLDNLNKQYILEIDENGLHQLGGEIPDNFKMPSNNFISNIQFLGIIRKSDPLFNWLPFDLHLICPILLNIDYVFVDYSNPLSPNIIYPENTEDITSEYDDLTHDSILVFEEIKVGLVESKKPATYLGHGIGNCGKPNWEQSFDIPKSPKNNKNMNFICQLITTNKVKTSRTNIFRADYKGEWLIKEFDFWCDGSLYVYFEPESKIGCYFIQNT